LLDGGLDYGCILRIGSALICEAQHGLASRVDGNVSMILTIMAFFIHPVFQKLWFTAAFPLFHICWDQNLYGLPSFRIPVLLCYDMEDRDGEIIDGWPTIGCSSFSKRCFHDRHMDAWACI
jgi:hypothetical protein